MDVGTTKEDRNNDTLCRLEDLSLAPSIALSKPAWSRHLELGTVVWVLRNTEEVNREFCTWKTCSLVKNLWDAVHSPHLNLRVGISPSIISNTDVYPRSDVSIASGCLVSLHDGKCLPG